MTDFVISDYRDTWLFHSTPFELHRTDRGHLLIEFNPRRPEPEQEHEVIRMLGKLIVGLVIAGVLYAIRWLAK